MALRTPLLMHSSAVLIKPENLQPFGSYKIRGVEMALRFSSKRKIAAASAGNMAQAVAYLAKNLGMPCRIFVPDSAPEVKKEAIRQLGATLTELPFHEVWEMVKNPPRQANELFVHPVFTPGLLQGYGTIAEEILRDAPDADAVIVPFGVGGLTLGIARALRRLGSKATVFACEPISAAPFHASRKAGRPTLINRIPSFVDAIGTPEVLPEVFREAVELNVESLVVSLAEIKTALRTLAVQHKLICEGAGAAALAGAEQLARTSGYRRIVGVLTGGNISPVTLNEILGATELPHQSKHAKLEGRGFGEYKLEDPTPPEPHR